MSPRKILRRKRNFVMNREMSTQTPTPNTNTEEDGDIDFDIVKVDSVMIQMDREMSTQMQTSTTNTNTEDDDGDIDVVKLGSVMMDLRKQSKTLYDENNETGIHLLADVALALLTMENNDEISSTSSSSFNHNNVASASTTLSLSSPSFTEVPGDGHINQHHYEDEYPDNEILSSTITHQQTTFELENQNHQLPEFPSIPLSLLQIVEQNQGIEEEGQPEYRNTYECQDHENIITLHAFYEYCPSEDTDDANPNPPPPPSDDILYYNPTYIHEEVVENDEMIIDIEN